MCICSPSQTADHVLLCCCAGIESDIEDNRACIYTTSTQYIQNANNICWEEQILHGKYDKQKHQIYDLMTECMLLLLPHQGDVCMECF